MQVQHKPAAVRLAVIGMALGLAVAGCSKGDSKDEESSSSASSSASTSAESSAPSSSEAASSTTAAAAAGDLSVLLMKPESIPPTPAGPFIGEAPVLDQTPGNPPSITQFYKAGDSNSVQSTIIMLPDAATAAQSAKDTMTSQGLASQITGTPEPAPNVTEDAMVINGTSADGSASMSILMFSVDTVVAQVAFIGKLDDPVPPDYLDSVGVIQLDAIEQGLPTLGG